MTEIKMFNLIYCLSLYWGDSSLTTGMLKIALTTNLLFMGHAGNRCHADTTKTKYYNHCRLILEQKVSSFPAGNSAM